MLLYSLLVRGLFTLHFQSLQLNFPIAFLKLSLLLLKFDLGLNVGFLALEFLLLNFCLQTKLLLLMMQSLLLELLLGLGLLSSILGLELFLHLPVD